MSDTTAVTDRKALKRKALDLLARRDHSVMELRNKLLRRGFCEEDVGEVLVALQEKRYLDDAAYAEARVRERATKGYGALVIRKELYARGVSRQVVDDALRTVAPDWRESALAVASRKQNATTMGESREDWRRQQRKLAGVLQRRGFDGEDIRWVFSRLSAGEGDE